jgi:signal transduction histidine kinase
MKEEFFKISSGLKNLIGSELITDNFVAVFELVKNSFDAKASEVYITFENTYSDKAKIIIQDNGKGMDNHDLINKWLFVAYSAKRDGTEDFIDYRDKLNTKRYYAGAKGVGRFSCDRLGRYLNLITLKDKPNSVIENLYVDWKKFEEDQKTEFITIPVEHKQLKTLKYNIKHGTILEISGINPEDWNRDNFIKLKDKLSKLVRPDLIKSKRERPFRIFLIVPEEKENDINVKDKFHAKGEGYLYRFQVNGEIRNFIFDNLNIRTTRIITEVDFEGKEIRTKLIDRDNYIYEIRESNKYKLLKNLSINLYFLNKSAKNIFSRKMGVDAVSYGNVFVYKNGFRIYPYGERGDDSLGIDNRAVQGYSRFIGVRNLIGQIDIQGENHELREATNREGLDKTKAYYQLTDTSPYSESLLLDTLKRLEKYVVEVTQWGVNLDDDIQDITDEKIKGNLTKLISNIADDKSLLALNYNKDIIKLIGAQEENSAKKLIRNFKRIAAESNNPDLLKDANRLEKTLNSAIDAKNSAEKEAFAESKEKKLIEEVLERKKEQLSIATSIASQDLDNITNLHHQVRVISDVIRTEIVLFSRKIDRGEKFSNQDLREFLNKISFETSKIESISKFGSRAIFENFTDVSKTDIVGFVENYISKISQYFSGSKMKIVFQTTSHKPFEIKFRPLDISIIIDNMISNAKKANASLLSIILESHQDNIINLIFRDNGNGLSKEVKDINEIFEKGFSTTRSTGLGLFHIQNIVTENNWTISVNNKLQKGLEFTLKLK